MASGVSNADVRYQGVVRMRGLPYSATHQDIVQFFSGLDIAPNGIHFASGPDGRPTGDAYVEFTTEGAATQAMSRNRQSIGSRYIELFRCTKGDLFNYLNQKGQVPGGQPSYLPPAQEIFANPNLAAYAATLQGLAANPALLSAGAFGENTCVRLRGLPYTATAKDISDFFLPVNAQAITVHVVMNAQGRPSGEAFVEFSSSDEAQRAMMRHKANLGSRYVEIFRATRTDMATQMAMAAYQMYLPSYMPPAIGSVLPSRAVPPRGVGGPAIKGPQGTVVRMRGVPYRASIVDVVEFFRGYDLLQDTIHFGTEGDGRLSGEVWVTFRTEEAAQRAVREKNRVMMGPRYIELFIE